MLFTFALQSESAHHFDDVKTLYTGVGKVNAVLALMNYLAEGPGSSLRSARDDSSYPPLVVNCGTVGSRDHKPGTVLQCRTFVQRDMDVTALGFPAFQTPFDDTSAVTSISR